MQNFQFRKKPIVIEAVQLTEGIMEQLMHGGHSQEIPGWLVKAFFRAPELPGSVQHAVRVLTITTLEGRMHAAQQRRSRSVARYNRSTAAHRTTAAGPRAAGRIATGTIVGASQSRPASQPASQPAS
jgi:hypothetical protein